MYECPEGCCEGQNNYTNNFVRVSQTLAATIEEWCGV